MRARYYSPEIRRFVNEDIIAGEISEAVTLNRYAYANGNPVSFVDSFGLYTQEIFDEDGHAIDDNDLGVLGGAGRGGVGHNARVSSGSQKQMTNQSNKVHGNSHSSTNMQHGYEIYEVNSGNVVKTGIS